MNPLLRVFESLRRVELFASLSEGQISLISQLVERREFQKGEVIIKESEDGSSGLFIVGEGSLEVYITNDDGRDTILTLLSKGDIFGEMSLLDNEPRSASIRAVVESELYQISRKNFLNQLKNFPDLSTALLIELSRRVRKANKQIGSLATLSVYGRIAGTLLNLVEERGVRITGEQGKKVIIVHNRPTHQQLADMSGTTRETVSRILADLKSKGAIAMNGKDLFVLCEETLRSH